jgi:hypothetical protein
MIEADVSALNDLPLTFIPTLWALCRNYSLLLRAILESEAISFLFNAL